MVLTEEHKIKNQGSNFITLGINMTFLNFESDYTISRGMEQKLNKYKNKHMLHIHT